jgi:hypothetical protein
MLTPEQVSAYLADPSKCPYCGVRIPYPLPEPYGNKTNMIRCKCGREWWQIFQRREVLVAIEEVE